MSYEMKNINTNKAQIESDNQTKFEEIKLLKDYVYGMDQRAKEVHKHKFMGKISYSNNENFDSVNMGAVSNCQSCGQISVINQAASANFFSQESEVATIIGTNKTLGKKFMDVI